MNEYWLHLTDNSLDLIRNVAGMIALIKNDGEVPKTILTDPAGYLQICHAAKRMNKAEWDKGLFLGMEVLVKDNLENAITVIQCHPRK